MHLPPRSQGPQSGSRPGPLSLTVALVDTTWTTTTNLKSYELSQRMPVRIVTVLLQVPVGDLQIAFKPPHIRRHPSLARTALAAYCSKKEHTHWHWHTLAKARGVKAYRQGLYHPALHTLATLNGPLLLLRLISRLSESESTE